MPSPSRSLSWRKSRHFTKWPALPILKTCSRLTSGKPWCSYGCCSVFGTNTPPSILGIPKCPPRWDRSSGLIDPEITIKLTSFDLARRIATSLIALFSKWIHRSVRPWAIIWLRVASWAYSIEPRRVAIPYGLRTRIDNSVGDVVRRLFWVIRQLPSSSAREPFMLTVAYCPASGRRNLDLFCSAGR